MKAYAVISKKPGMETEVMVESKAEAFRFIVKLRRDDPEWVCTVVEYVFIDEVPH